MGESVSASTLQFRPVGFDRGFGPHHIVRRTNRAPVTARHFVKTTQQSLFRATPDKNLAVIALYPEGITDPGWFGGFFAFSGQFRGDARFAAFAGRLPRTNAARRITWRADGCPQI